MRSILAATKLRIASAYASLLAFMAMADRRFVKVNDAGATSLSGIGTMALGVVAVILAAVIAIRIIASLFSTYAGAVVTIADGFNNTTWGDGTANQLSPIFRLVVAILGILGIFALVVGAIFVVKRRS